MVGETNYELARYDGLIQAVVNPAILLSPLTTQEAVLSSKIEGTQVSLDEVLEHEAGVKLDAEKKKDIQEIINYRHALMLGSDYLKERPLSLHLIRQLHKILLNSVRGQTKKPSEFRNTQNWIGTPGTPIEQASFVPPCPLQLMYYLENWEEYIKGDDLDYLIQLACVHAQFEIIHPFLDGNGRIGRLLIPLFLYQKKKISNPVFYLSEYLEKNRTIYYNRLNEITSQNKWNDWIIFFLEAIKIQAKNNSLKVKQILDLYENMKNKITDLTHSQHSIQLLDAIFDSPIFKTIDIAKKTGIPKPTVSQLLKSLRDGNILQVIKPAKGRAAAILVFSELINISEGKKVF